MENKVYSLNFRGGKAVGLIPLFILMICAIYFFVFAQVYDTIALALGGFVAIIIGSFLAKDMPAYWAAAIKGMSGELGSIMALILVVVGIFGKMMTAGHIAQGFIWIGDLMSISGSGICVFTFVTASIIATSTGSSIGTILTIVPILYPAGIMMGANPIIIIGAIMSGALFGDSIGPVSDVTIASTQTQEYLNKEGRPDIGGAVKSRLKYSLTAGALAIILFFIFGSSGSAVSTASQFNLKDYADPSGLLMLIPMAVLLTVAFKTKSIFMAATAGIVSGTIVGLGFGIFTFADVLSVTDGTLHGFIIDGLNNMLGTIMFVYSIVAMMGILTESGLMDALIQKLLQSKAAKTVIGAELIISLGAAVTSLCVGSANGPACLMFGPIANEIGKKHKLHPYRRANLVAAFTSTIPTMSPFSSLFIVITVGAVNNLCADYPFISEVSPLALPIGMVFCLTFPLVFLVSIFSGWGREYESDAGEPILISKKEVSRSL